MGVCATNRKTWMPAVDFLTATLLIALTLVSEIYFQ